MNKRHGILERMRESLICSEHKDNVHIDKQLSADVFMLISVYLEIYDIHNKTNFRLMFEFLYLDEKHISFEKIAEQCFVSLITIRRFNAQLIEFADTLIKDTDNFYRLFEDLKKVISQLHCD